MMYAMYGVIVPVKDENEGNALICEAANLYGKLDIKEDGLGFSLCGLPEIDDIKAFNEDLTEFFNKYSKE